MSLFNPDAALLVIGDVMLDGYASGDVERISPEAPVPVLRHLAHHEVPGGGANVAMNIAALGGKAHLIGLVGADDEGARLAQMLGAHGVDTHFVATPDRPTIFKLRILAGNHQMLRIDKEDTRPHPSATEQGLIDVALALLPQVSGVILSDYSKGCLSDAVLAQVIEAARARDIPVFVDPKRTDFSFYAGATYITPNRGELAKASGIACESDGNCQRAAIHARDVTGANILLTRSEHGMAFYPIDGDEILLPTEAQEVFDVSGAGDSVVATFALAIVSGHAVPQALRLANSAAGLVIAKAGTATISEEELAAALERDHVGAAFDGAVSWAEAARIRERWRREKLIVGFTNGCFDLLHPGHIAILRESAQRCDRLIVALNTDASVRRLKGPERPIQSEDARAEVMAAIGHVDLVVLFDQETPYELINLLKPDLLVKGSDYTEDQVVGADIVKTAGGSVALVDLRAGHSTTNLVARSKAESAAA